jgi:flagellar biogenesis protein FliO
MARRLAPPSTRDDNTASHSGLASTGARRLADFGVPVQSIYTVITALAIVLGAFLLFAWALRRGGKNSGTRRGLLPADAVSVLGRVPLAARQFADLLRVGNKLVLVAQTPSGPTTLTEITDPVEVDRLVGLCQQFDPHSTTKAFEQVFQQLSSEPTSGGLLDDPLPASLTSAASAYRSHRGAARV